MRNPLLTIFAAAAFLLIGTNIAPIDLHAQTLQIDSATANWIEGFADFTRWPNESQSDRITIGIINAPEVATYLKRRADARNSKPTLKVRNLNIDDSFGKLDIVFVGPGTRDRWDEIFKKCEGKGILCIGAQEGFNQKGGCVELVVRKNRLRFYIDTANAKKFDVTLSSKLLELSLDPKP